MRAMEIDKFLAASEKVAIDDLDWALARQVGLNDEERFLLTYFTTIETQTVFYQQEILKTRAAEDPDTLAFLAMWNYEEYFHGYSLQKLMKECGHDMGKDLTCVARKNVTLRERFEGVLALVASRVFAAEFPALYLAWGAIQEMTTTTAYEQLVKITKNPVLAELARRIGKQERRHFAWYFNNARERLERSARARWLTAKVLKAAWTPVGAGVKRDDEVDRVLVGLFPGQDGTEAAARIDAKIATLPGLEDAAFMSGAVARARVRLGVPAVLPGDHLRVVDDDGLTRRVA
jgi:hypothetical protein